MIDVLLMEPSSINKRRRVSDKFRRHDLATALGLAEITEKLRCIRRDSVENIHEHHKTLAKNLSAQADVNVIFADTAAQAAAEIKRINKGRRVAVNKSAVVNNEIVPELLKLNFEIIETYGEEFNPTGNHFNDYLKLPELDFDSVFNTFQVTSHPDISRKASVAEHGSKDFTGVLGLNAISAKDGTISLFQHMGNISAIYEQAKSVIFIAGLDKIVDGCEDAIFLTKCMAAFGWKIILKARNSLGETSAQISIKDMPFSISPADTDLGIHLILLDNGRTDFLKNPYKDLLTCIGCRACVNDCPVSSIFHASGRWTPKEYLAYFISGSNPSTELCLQCKTCRMNCPLEIDIPDMVLNVRANLLGKGRVPLIQGLLSNFEDVARWGSRMPRFANAMSKNGFIRQLGEKIAGLSSERNMPEFHNPTFRQWFENRAGEKKRDQ